MKRYLIVHIVKRKITENRNRRRNVTIQEVGNTAAFLASDNASAITGQTLYVDSGYNIIGMPAID